MKKGLNINEIYDNDLYDGELVIGSCGKDKYIEVFSEGDFSVGDTTSYPHGNWTITITIKRIGKVYNNLKNIPVKRIYIEKLQHKNKEQ